MFVLIRDVLVATHLVINGICFDIALYGEATLAECPIGLLCNVCWAANL